MSLGDIHDHDDENEVAFGGADPDDHKNLAAALTTKGVDISNMYYCRNCVFYYKKSELHYWSGDDRGHLLCPGCDEDMVECWVKILLSVS